MLNKKAQSLSLHTIIIAVLALIVLGVILFFVIGGVSPLNEGISCAKNMGFCRNSCDGMYENYDYDSNGNELVCPGNQRCCKLRSE